MLAFRRQKRIPRAARGQSLVEFSLTLVMLLILMSGLLDIGRAYFVYTAVADAAGEGALFLSVEPTCFSPAISGCADPNNVQYRMQAAGGQMVELHNSDERIEFLGNGCYYFATVNAGGTMPTTLTLDPPPKSVAGCPSTYSYSTQDEVNVQLIQHYTLLTPFIPRIAGVSWLPLNVIAVQTIIVK